MPFYFFPSDYPGLSQHRPGYSLGQKIKLYITRNKNVKKTMQVLVFQFTIWQILKRYFAGTNISLSINFLVLKSKYIQVHTYTIQVYNTSITGVPSN